MKKILLSAMLLIFGACNKVEEFSLLDYSEAVFETLFNPNLDWCTTSKSYIYSEEPISILVSDTMDNSLRLLNKGSGTVYFDVPNRYYALLVLNNSGEYKKFNIEDTEIHFNAASRSTRADAFVYTSYLTDTVLTFANQRGWLPGEEFYIYNPVTIESGLYNEDFKTIFRSIIFNYFPNGRTHNNLPKIKKSGYYNESSYPITTGDKPIIVSPVYKNDGGYHEISEAELYYYYFKGDLSVLEIESLPKYRAIDLSIVYSNDDNDIISKESSYILMYWNGNIGTSLFPKGYKIGFCYKSNTTYEKPKKQGELYGDGRLNYNINSWGNFKTSKLGPTEPRMAWMTVNNKMFLCVESGTDADFNDLICEVEGGIEPIIIIPDEPEHQFYTFCYEDRRLGDYDLNDVVIKGTRLDETHVEWTLMACGANDELYIKNILGNIINDNTEVHALFGKPLNCFINTEKNDNTPYIKDTVTVLNTFSFIDADCHPIIYDKTMNWTVSIARKGEDPHAIMIPYDFRWSLERICVKDAYLKFNSWGALLIEDTDWYLYWEDNKVK